MKSRDEAAGSWNATVMRRFREFTYIIQSIMMSKLAVFSCNKMMTLIDIVLQQTLCKDPKHLQTNRALENDTVLHSLTILVQNLQANTTHIQDI